MILPVVPQAESRVGPRTSSYAQKAPSLNHSLQGSSAPSSGGDRVDLGQSDLGYGDRVYLDASPLKADSFAAYLAGEKSSGARQGGNASAGKAPFAAVAGADRQSQSSSPHLASFPANGLSPLSAGENSPAAPQTSARSPLTTKEMTAKELAAKDSAAGSYVAPHVIAPHAEGGTALQSASGIALGVPGHAAVPAAGLAVDASASFASGHTGGPERGGGLADTGHVSPFQVMDASGSGSAASSASLTHSSSAASSLVAGYHDPQLGYVELKAQMGADGVHASLVAATEEGSTILAGHMPALHQWLNERSTPVETLNIGVREESSSRSFAGTAGEGGASQPGGQSSASAGGGQAQSEESRPGVRQISGGAEAVAPMGFEGALGAAHVARAADVLLGGTATYISVLA